MPKSGKGKGRKTGGSQRQLGTPGLSNAPPKYKTPEPEQRQLATPSATPKATCKAPVQFSLRMLALIKEEEEREKKEREERKKVVGTEEKKRVKTVPYGDSDDELFEIDEGSDEDEVKCGPWVAKGNAPEYLDSDDEAELDGWGEEEMRKRRDRLSKDEWRDVGEFLLTILANFLDEGGPSGQDRILREILGEDDDEDAAENREDGKTAVFMRLHALQMQLEEEPKEIEKLEKERDSLRKKVKLLELAREMYMEEEKKGEAGIAGAQLEKLSNFLAEKIRCSPGRPLQTLMGAVSDHLETLEVRSAEDPKFKNLKLETLRKTEKLKKVEAEKKVLLEEKQKLEESLVVVQREQEQSRASTYIPEPVKRIEVVEVGIQVFPAMVDATTEAQEEIPVEKEEKKRQRQSKGKGKEKEGAKDSTQIQEDVEMVDEERFALCEDLLDYEKELDEAPVTPPVTKKQPTKRQVGPKAVRTPTAKYKKPTKPVKEKEDYIDTRAFVVHGIPCQRPVADTTQDVKKTGMRGVIGARWLLGGQRRMGKATSSVVIFLKSLVSFHVQGGQMRMKVRGHWLPVDVYDFERGRVRPEVRGTVAGSDSGSDLGW